MDHDEFAYEEEGVKFIGDNQLVHVRHREVNKTYTAKESTEASTCSSPKCSKQPNSDTSNLLALLLPDPIPPQTPKTLISSFSATSVDDDIFSKLL